jgi:hypothetical protein
VLGRLRSGRAKSPIKTDDLHSIKGAIRRESGKHGEVLDEHRGKRARHYLQNFHFQSGGWMTEESARRYDTQVEVLFKGTSGCWRGPA